jgi:eukaryotic-like serine/threonine-protein kinase
VAEDDATVLVTVESGGATDQPALGSIRPPLGRGDAIGRYIVLHRAGAGGMGEVYAAYDPELDRKVALKLLSTRGSADDPHASTRLLREAQALAKLSHPNVVAVYDVGTHEDRVFIAMEYIDGVTLQAWLAERARPWRTILATLLHAARALAAAHDAGIIHRDFKPGNVMITTPQGLPGEIRVLDFGLARRLGSELEPISSSGELAVIEASQASRRMMLDLTRTGLVTGTPAYMAPEQFTGGVHDARTDQFAFCVTLHEALWHARPFEAADATALRDAVLAGRVRATPEHSAVPLRLRRPILRGLAVDPAERHPTMRALIEALEQAAVPRWRRALLPVAAFAVVAGVVVVATGSITGADPPCAGVEDRLVGAWDPARRTELAAAFTATGTPYAADVLRRVETGLDEYANAWVDRRRDACEATRVRIEQSEELLDRRIACFDDRLRELGALTQQLAGADAAIVEKAPDALSKLGDLRRCDASVVLGQRLAPPPPELAEAIAAARSELAGLEVIGLAGKYADALAKVEPIVERARELAYAPLLGEAMHQLGALQAAQGELAKGEATHLEALLVAEASGHDLLELKARLSLAATVGMLLGRPDDGRVHARFAAAVAERIGPSHGLVGAVPLTEALVEFRAGNNSEAEAKMLVALAEREAGRGPEHPEVASVLVNLGAIQVALGKYELAEHSFERARAIFEAAYGPKHPMVASTVNNLALALYKERRYDEAIATHNIAIAIWEEALPKNHPELAKVHHNVGTVLSGVGRYDEALREYDIALRMKIATLGPDHPSVAVTETNIGDALNKLGRPAEALPHLERARDIMAAALGPEHADNANVYTTMGISLLALGRAREAREALEHSEAIASRQPGIPDDLAEIRFTLARALESDPSQRARARELARAAHDAYAALGEPYEKETAATRDWLAAHGE